MSSTKHVKISIYLEPSQCVSLRRAAARRGKTVSCLMRDMLSGGQMKPLDREDYLRLAVNALLKYHPNENLLAVVEQEWAVRRSQAHG